MTRHVAVIIGTGGMGEAIARRIGTGARLLLADRNPALLDAVTVRLSGEGYDVTAAEVDVTDQPSVAALAARASGMGEVRHVVHTAGVSPVQAPVAAVLAVDLLGVALMAEEFGAVVAPGGAGVVISSMAGHLLPPLAREDAVALATTPASGLLALPAAAEANFPDSGLAYAFAKQANLLRVRAASAAWGARRARINSISPGVIATAMGQAELASDHGAGMRAMVESSNAARLGTPADIAAAAAFLLGPEADFISGTDLLVDGGVVAAFTTR